VKLVESKDRRDKKVPNHYKSGKNKLIAYNYDGKKLETTTLNLEPKIQVSMIGNPNQINDKFWKNITKHKPLDIKTVKEAKDLIGLTKKEAREDSEGATMPRANPRKENIVLIQAV